MSIIWTFITFNDLVWLIIFTSGYWSKFNHLIFILNVFFSFIDDLFDVGLKRYTIVLSFILFFLKVIFNY
jgi:hypothetical protein